MDKILKLIFSGIVLLITASLVVLPFSYEVFHWIRMSIHFLIVLIPILYWDKSVKSYALPVGIGLLIYFISAHVTVYYGRYFELRLLFSYVVFVLFIKGFTYFKGYTFKSLHLFILLGIGGAFYSAVYTNLGSLSMMIALYIVLFVVMCWQGANLYYIHRGYGYFYILLYVLVDICNNVLNGINLFAVHFDFLSKTTQVLHWVALSILAYTTTLSRKRFDELLRPNYRSSRRRRF